MKALTLLAMSLLAAALGAQQEMGAASVEIRTVPRADVAWEGAALGRTNADGRMLVEGVPPGTFAVTLSADGYIERTERVVVEPGYRILELELQPAATAGGRADVPAAASAPRAAWVLAAGAALLLLSAVAWLRGRRGGQSSREVEMIAPGRVAPTATEGSAPEQSLTFLDDLKRREQTLDSLVEIKPRGPGSRLKLRGGNAVEDPN